jgi:hypothetical protein
MPLPLPPENWGEALRRAYRQGKHHYGYTYASVAARVSMATNVSDQSLLRLEYLKAPPPNRRRRQIAALYIIALGFDPADLGLDRDSDLPPLLSRDRILTSLDPNVWAPRRPSDAPLRSR